MTRATWPGLAGLLIGLCGLSLPAVIHAASDELASTRSDQIELSGSAPAGQGFRGRQTSWTIDGARRVEQSLTSTQAGADDPANTAFIYSLTPFRLVRQNADSGRFESCAGGACQSYLASVGAVPLPTLPEGCEVEVLDSRFAWPAVGEPRTIGGYAAQGHQLEWILALRDKDKREGVASLTGVLWSSEAVPENLARTDRMFDSQLTAAKGLAPTRLDHFLPEIPMLLIRGGLLSQLGAAQRDQALSPVPRTGRQMLAGRLEWQLSGSLCGEQRGAYEPGAPGRHESVIFRYSWLLEDWGWREVDSDKLLTSKKYTEAR